MGKKSYYAVSFNMKQLEENKLNLIEKTYLKMLQNMYTDNILSMKPESVEATYKLKTQPSGNNYWLELTFNFKD